MERRDYEHWSELAFDPARLQRIAESERNDAMDSIFKDLLDGLRQRFWTSDAKSASKPDASTPDAKGA